MTTFLQRDDFAVTARVLGALFYYSPESHETAPLVQALLNDDWQAQWPLDAEALAPVAAMFKTHSEESLPQAWQRLFIGPYALPSPPWGSVWLDREIVLFGDSTLALRQWMRENGIQFEMQQNEPEDHFGSLLLLAAWLAENDRHHECEQLLAWHLFPWSSRFLDVFIDHAGHPFYQALGQLARLTLAQWQAQLIIPVAVKPLFR
ncbi:Tat proofreading chaperone DmsD [Salmonella enterica subsp. enterica serovar Cubana]|nr:Tat proofreading chaperone DmsD [Salmonella enterica]EBV5817850.1 Tat proofreading chaperone DmsD [Salmonella enterica subsp. enterica serovar Cubana]EAT6827967.1 Tat proofreading chaperone DmsD [Salmonella enterica]EAY0271053.1 Tat proofreading chaperone DmsD [Salmonella enterica]EDO2787364.1 Tat proofreading chaperone DmsD [Salmonella enterica]